MNMSGDSASEIAIPAYGTTDTPQKRKIFESILSINTISQIRKDLIELYVGSISETNEKDENEILVAFFRRKGIITLWESFIIARNLLAHPYNTITKIQFRSLVINTKQLIKFVKENSSTKARTM